MQRDAGQATLTSGHPLQPFMTALPSHGERQHRKTSEGLRACIRVLRYLRDAGGGWSPIDPEPLRALAEELANVIKTGAGA